MENSEKTTIPDFLSHLPTYRGYPVPYFVPKDENGVYQLKYASQQKMENCIAYNKCCICFKKLVKGEYYFVSGPMGLASQTDSHPPMHKRCAEYQLKVCPHLFFEKTHRTTDENAGEAWQIRDKPKEFFLVHAKQITPIHPDGKHLIVKYSQIATTLRYTYQDGKLQQNN